MQRGDTVVLHTTGQGRWGAPKRAVEVLRVSGPRGEEEFGRIDCISALPDGGVVVYDAQGQPVDGAQVFDQDGRSVTLGVGSLQEVETWTGVGYDDERSWRLGGVTSSGAGVWNAFPLRLFPDAAIDAALPAGTLMYGISSEAIVVALRRALQEGASA